jgi:DNA-binding transcriptional LysR family regulator
MSRGRDFDLNLLRVFDAVMRRGSVAEAGRELGVTASAISHALARLRVALGDELFVPSEGGMIATDRARELYPDFGDALSRINRAVKRDPFDPHRSSRVFTVAASSAPLRIDRDVA